jgi:hypothetical protein
MRDDYADTGWLDGLGVGRFNSELGESEGNYRKYRGSLSWDEYVVWAREFFGSRYKVRCKTLRSGFGADFKLVRR